MDSDDHLVYLALLEHPVDSVSDLSERLAMPEERVRGALDRLSAMALLRWDAPRGPELITVEPATALSMIMARQDATLREHQARHADSRVAVERWLTEHADESDDNAVERVDTLAATRTRIAQLAADCREEFWSLNPDGPQTPENLEASKAPNIELFNRGIAMRAMFNDAARNDRATAAHLEWLADLGADVRTTPVLPMRMLIIDREVCVVPIDERDSSRGVQVVRGSGIVSGLIGFFLATWGSGTSLGRRRIQAVDLPSETERQVLMLWGKGNTDAMVARKLGVSDRTIRRLSERLAERLGAQSRFAMGARAAELGWLSSDDLL